MAEWILNNVAWLVVGVVVVLVGIKVIVARVFKRLADSSADANAESGSD